MPCGRRELLGEFKMKKSNSQMLMALARGIVFPRGRKTKGLQYLYSKTCQTLCRPSAINCYYGSQEVSCVAAPYLRLVCFQTLPAVILLFRFCTRSLDILSSSKDASPVHSRSVDLSLGYVFVHATWRTSCAGRGQGLGPARSTLVVLLELPCRRHAWSRIAVRACK